MRELPKGRISAMSTEFHPPLRAIDFVLNEVVDLGHLATLPGYEHADPQTVRDALEEAGRLFADVVAPLNRIGDKQGSQLQPDGSVKTPDGFKEAYAQYRDSGWGGVGFDPAYGGGGFPWVVTIALQEMLCAANKAFALAPMLTQGSIDMLHSFATEEWKERLLPALIEARWSGTMNLTEPQAGSDVGALTTKAVRQDDGTYRITGQKIFISWGEQDLTENIIHLVLARVPGAPPGTKGISCFIVPKFLINDDASPGVRNDIRCVALEHKMGLMASPTCVLSFGDNGGAIGYLIGEEHQGMRYMFKMMNSARLSVGVEGLALAERSYQQALSFAGERVQGRPANTAAGETRSIIEHADVRRMLLTMRSLIDAMRMLTYSNAEAFDIAKRGTDDATRAAADEYAGLLTPISKAFSTDMGIEVTSLAIQVHGGMGYIEETGVAQYYRDARISAIYEGTNGIQAIDLVGRKLPMRGGAIVKELFARIAATDADLSAAGERVATIRTHLADNLRVLQEATDWIMANGPLDPQNALAGATPYLRMFGWVVCGWFHARAALAALARIEAGTDADGFAQARLVSATFYCEQLMPQAKGLFASVVAGPSDLYAIDSVQLGL